MDLRGTLRSPSEQISVSSALSRERGYGRAAFNRPAPAGPVQGPRSLSVVGL